jgi:hypothetical protein
MVGIGIDKAETKETLPDRRGAITHEEGCKEAEGESQGSHNTREHGLGSQ